MTRLTRRKYVVDHVIPLVHPFVCGLHVATNLRVIEAPANAHKCNDFSPDQMELPLNEHGEIQGSFFSPSPRLAQVARKVPGLLAAQEPAADSDPDKVRLRQERLVD